MQSASLLRPGIQCRAKPIRFRFSVPSEIPRALNHAVTAAVASLGAVFGFVGFAGRCGRYESDLRITPSVQLQLWHFHIAPFASMVTLRQGSDRFLRSFEHFGQVIL